MPLVGLLPVLSFMRDDSCSVYRCTRGMPGPWIAPSTEVTGGLIDFRFLVH